jgi:oligosaccharide repeat unit polymerase
LPKKIKINNAFILKNNFLRILKILIFLFIMICLISIYQNWNLHTKISVENTDEFRNQIKGQEQNLRVFFSALNFLLCALGNICLCSLFLKNKKLKVLGFLCLVMWLTYDLLTGNRESIKGFLFCIILYFLFSKSGFSQKVLNTSVFIVAGFSLFSIIGMVRNQSTEFVNNLV